MWMLQPDMDVGNLQVDGSDMDIVSFDDSEQFEEEDSVCSSWMSDNDQVAYWSGWKQSTHSTDVDEQETIDDCEVLSLMELSAKCVAMNYAFEVVEQHTPPIPEALQLRIAFWSFPESEEEIRLYSCLACGSNEKFKQGHFLALSGHVIEVLQIGFHLSGVVTQPVAHSIVKQKHNVSITFDRGHITSCKCSCSEGTTWCEHAIALCIYRIVKKKDVSLRAPVSESLARLERDQLQKFAQYLISELPQQIRMAQKLLDELLGSKQSEINLQDGAPDPTAGASTTDDAKWVLDETSLRENIKKILARCCGCLPLVVVDVNSSFLTSAPPVSLEWSNFIRSFQGHDPEAMWNLLSIVRHMFARGDHNASMLLSFITEECLLCYQMMFYWLSSYSSLQGNNNKRAKSNNAHGALHPNNDISRHASAHLMEEVVHLWELTVMMPYITDADKLHLREKFVAWDKQIIEAAKKGQGQGLAIHPPVRVAEDFVGFQPAIRACDLDWDIYYIIMGISEALLKELSFKGRGMKLDEFTDSTVEKMYQRISSLIPPDMDEFGLVTKLAHSLSVHGFVNKASKLASELARRIICGYPERIFHGETNFSSITEKADSLCNILLKCAGNDRIVFEIAILGLTVPRFPAATNMEEVKLSYLEMSLYQKLTNIIITDERLAFIRFQARKLLANPMCRGDAVLPLIIVTYIFEVLCREHVTSNVLRGKNLRMMNPDSISDEDDLLGYKCALGSLALCTSTVDHKQPMLCESVRHHRRDLALALLSHCKTDEEKIDEIIAIILDRERHGFMRSKQVNHNIVKWSGKEAKKIKMPSTDDIYHAQDAKLQNKYGFSFGEGIQPGPSNPPKPPAPTTKRSDETKPPTRSSADLSARGHGSHGNHGNHPRRHDRSSKLSSDSDSGHGEGGDKRMRGLTVSLNNTRKSQQHQRRQLRQPSNRGRGAEKNLRNERSASCDKSSRSERASTWVKHNKTSRSRKSSKSKQSRELTESDSGQEMHFSFEGDSCPPPIENWDDEVKATPKPSNVPEKNRKPSPKKKDISLTEFIPPVFPGLPSNSNNTNTTNKKQNGGKSERWSARKNDGNEGRWSLGKDEDDEKSERWSMSSPDSINVSRLNSNVHSNLHSSNLHSNALLDEAAYNIPSNSDRFIPHHPSNAVNPTGSHGNLNNADFNIEIMPTHLANSQSSSKVKDNDTTSDLGDDDDFNIEADMFHATLVQKVPSADESPNLSENDAFLEATIIQNVLESDTLGTTIYPDDHHKDSSSSSALGSQSSAIGSDEKPKLHGLAVGEENDVAEVTTDFSSPDLDDGTVPSSSGDNLRSINDDNRSIGENVFFPTPIVIDDDEIEADLNKIKDEIEADIKSMKRETISVPEEKEKVDVDSTRASSAEKTSTRSPSRSPDEVVVISNEDRVIGNEDTKEEEKADSVTDLLQNVLSLVGEILEENNTHSNAEPRESASGQIADSTASKKEEIDQLEDLRLVLESVCIEQQPNVIGTGPPEEDPLTRGPFAIVPPSDQTVKSKKKPKKNKKNKAKVSLNMQSIEAEAYSLFELAKSVLIQARNNNTFSADVDEVITTNTINKRLQLAAFEIGLFALNVHNYSSPNWFSRTYSSYVSWIENQAVEVGSPAIRCLNVRWEGVLTPSESVQIATRACRSGDSAMRRTAAELALSCLPYSQNLSPVDITHTINLCKTQDTGMLERACSAVENAGRHGGVQPELLFHIAREWHYLHEERQKQSSTCEDDHVTTRVSSSHSNITLNHSNHNANNRGDVIDPVYMTPEQFVQEQMHQQAQEILGRQLPRTLGTDQFTWIYPQYYGSLHHCPLPQQAIHSRRIPNIDSYAVPVTNPPDELNIAEIPRYLQNSYRVGIRALEALTLRMPDETPDVKFALAPPMSDDIRWMCALSAQLGPPYLKIFCKIVFNAVTSPYLLHDLALEAARHFALYNPAQLASHLRSTSVSPIVQKALAMYTELVHYELILLAQSGYPDFVELLRKTRSAFCMAPGGMARFNEILEVVSKSYPKKRELMQLIMNGLSKA